MPRPARVAAKEPIVQFLALGGALFLLHGLFRPPGAAPGGEIVVSQARVAAIAQTFARTWQRPPTRSELDALIDDHIRTEVLVRESLALGLDRDDAIIRRRLRQKMEFLSEEQASAATPPAPAICRPILTPIRSRSGRIRASASVISSSIRNGAATRSMPMPPGSWPA